MYMALILVQAVYAFFFIHEVWSLVLHAPTLTESELLLTVLGLIDIVMIANLILMVTLGGYDTFVANLRLENHPDKPEWLTHISASALKVKLATALIGISSVHLLKTFVNSANLTNDTVARQIAINLTFILSAYVLARMEKGGDHKGANDAQHGLKA